MQKIREESFSHLNTFFDQAHQTMGLPPTQHNEQEQQLPMPYIPQLPQMETFNHLVQTNAGGQSSEHEEDMIQATQPLHDEISTDNHHMLLELLP